MGQLLSVRATITILLTAGTPSPPGCGVVDLEAVLGPLLLSGHISFLPTRAACLWGPLVPSAEAPQAAPGLRSAGTVVLIATLSVLLAVLLTTLLALLIYTW